MGKRDKRYSKTVGVRPFSGHRYVQDRNVRIEWFAGGRRFTQTIGKNTAATRRQADQILSEALAEVKAQAEGRTTGRDTTLAALFAKFNRDCETRPSLKSGEPLRPRTIAGYLERQRYILEYLDTSMPAANLRKGAVREFVTHLRERHLAEGTISRIVEHLRQVYRWAVGEMEILEGDPLAGLKMPKVKGESLPYTIEERKRLVDALVGLPKRAWRFRLVALTESLYGVRANQSINQRWSDVDFDKAYSVHVPDGQEVNLEGTVTFRKDTLGSKGQPDRELPMIPLVREAYLAAWNHRREESPWVVWNWRDHRKPSTYGSMNQQLRKLERDAGVDHLTGRAFHAFRRALNTEIVEQLGVSHAARWTGDTPEVILRYYVKPSSEAEAQAAAFLVRKWSDAPKLQPDCNTVPKTDSPDAPTLDATGTYGTGAGGLEPPTSWLTARRSAN